MSLRQKMNWLAAVSTVLICIGIVACESRQAPPGNLYFVQAGPPDDMPLRGPHSVIVYKLDEESGLLSAIARTPLRDWTDDVKCYTNLSRLIVSTSKTAWGGVGDADKIYIFGADSAERFDVIEMKDYGACYDFRLAATSTTGDIPAFL